MQVSEHLIKFDPSGVLFLKSRTVDCPNCGGSGKAGTIPLSNGTRPPARCFMCNGSCRVPEWDYDRLLKMVKDHDIQTELF